MSNNSDTPPTSADAPRPRKKRAPTVLVILVAVALVTGATVWFVNRNQESTDDAQVEGHVMSVAARITGQVERVLVQDNQLVEVGAVLVEIEKSELKARLEAAVADSQSARASLKLAEAQLALTEKNTSAGLRQAKGGVSQAASGVASSKAVMEQATADLTAADSRLKLATLERDRVNDLFDRGSISRAELDARQTAFEQAEAGAEQARARLESTKAGIEGGYAGIEQAAGRLAAAQTGPEQIGAARASVELARARLGQAQAAQHLTELNLSYAMVRAPARGVVSRRNVEVGSFVSPDRPLLALVPLDDLWIVANFKEDQLRSMQPGMRAAITVDTFGGRQLGGHVQSLAAGTGSRFALLPPDNASGNFVKVVQRIPVLIRIDDRAGLELRPGMSADVTVYFR
jgi:membrane fusion protein (multidrug efflux system)